MRGEAMKRICERLSSGGLNMRNFAALDFFAREGDWQTVVYADRVGSLAAWELNPEFEVGLRRNLPSAKIQIVDSYTHGMATGERFDFIVLDNPQGTFGADDRYCEHFEALPVALRLLRPEGFLIFNLNWAPFNFDDYPEWQRRRSNFYRTDDTRTLSLQYFLLPFYRTYFEDRSFNVLQCFVEPRNAEYLAYAVVQLVSR